MSHSIALIPLGEIDDTALSRDRTRLDETAMTELRLSIAASGLRMPVELFHLAEVTRAGEKYGILSGFRRIQAFRAQHAMTGQARYESIPAFLREPASLKPSSPWWKKTRSAPIFRPGSGDRSR